MRASRGFLRPLKPLMAWPRVERRIMERMTTAAARFILRSTLAYGCTFGLLGLCCPREHAQVRAL